MKAAYGRSTSAMMVGCLWLVALAAWPSLTGTADPSDDPSQKMKDASLAISNPDEYAWRLFARLNVRAGDPDHPCDDIKKYDADTSNDACWERWASASSKDFGDVYAKYREDTIEWPDHKPHDEFRVSAPVQKIIEDALNKHRLDKLFSVQMADKEVLDESKRYQLLIDQPGGIGQGEEIRINRATFDYIKLRQLWYGEGQADAARCGKAVSFPPGSVIVKANWEKVACDTAAPGACASATVGFHWQKADDGQVWKLTALHITSKALPNWLWATWEHKDNPNPCATVPCRDSFGYAGGMLSAELKQVFSENGTASEWQNYRLHGTQVSFTDTAGRPTLMGNSVIEPGLKCSSCISCHTRVAVNKDPDWPIFKPVVGAPAPGWFEDGYLPLDFVWSLRQVKCRKDNCFRDTNALPPCSK